MIVLIHDSGGGRWHVIYQDCAALADRCGRMKHRNHDIAVGAVGAKWVDSGTVGQLHHADTDSILSTWFRYDGRSICCYDGDGNKEHSQATDLHHGLELEHAENGKSNKCRAVQRERKRDVS